MDYAQALLSTTAPAWSNLPVEEKREVLQAVENHFAAFEGRAEREVQTEEMEEGYYGFYDHTDPGFLHISHEALLSPEEAVKTTLHEGRHAYQHDCLDRNEGFPQPILDQFREGFDNYVSPEEDFLAYANNFTETDAENFANQQIRLMNMEREALLAEQEMDMTPDPAGERNEAGYSEAEMNMVPGVVPEHNTTEYTVPEMNMNPDRSLVPDGAEYAEPEMNMHPESVSEHSAVEYAEPEMNMSVGLTEEQNAAEYTEPDIDMTPYDLAVKNKPAEDTVGKEQTGETSGREQAGETISQEPGLFQ